MTPKELEGKTALVTGAASGIGRATALRFAKEGCHVSVVDIDREWGEETARLVRESGGTSVFVRADVASESAVTQAIEETTRALGEINVLVNNAGVAVRAAIVDMTDAEWDRVINTNLKGAFLMSKHVLPRFLASGGGVIVNTASNAALVGFAGLGAYCASKGGIIQLTRALALEYADKNIRVNAVAPSSTLQTRMFDARLEAASNPEGLLRAIARANPMKRLGTAQEVAELMLFLASDRSCYITGGVFAVDGGITAASRVPDF